jgi:flavin reductase (DIM6/NTAB) family NADH-FMN oxidoreductase RutF
MNAPHVVSEPSILYFGTPVVLISSLNEDGSANLAPMSSAFWLGWRCILGLNAASKTTLNMIRTGQCVLNLPAAKHDLMQDDDVTRGKIVSFEVRVTRVHIHPDITMDGLPNRVDPDKWRPLMMSFQRYYGLGDEVHESTLAKIPEEIYRMPDITRSRTAELVNS